VNGSVIDLPELADAVGGQASSATAPLGNALCDRTRLATGILRLATFVERNDIHRSARLPSAPGPTEQELILLVTSLGVLSARPLSSATGPQNIATQNPV